MGGKIEIEGERTLQERIAQLEERLAALTRQYSAAREHAESLQAASVVTAEVDGTGRAIQRVLSEMRRVVPYDSASLQELREGRLVIIGGVGFADLDVILGESFDINNADSPNGEVVHRRRPLIVADTEQYRAFRRGLHVGAGIRSWLGVPLIYGDDLMGIIALDKVEANFYNTKHATTALAFASIAAAAMAQRR